jgi:ribosome maturation factor RimP
MSSGGTQSGLGPLWDAIEAIAKEEGVDLFDLDIPGGGADGGSGGILRVYITRSKSSPDVHVPADDSHEEGDESGPSNRTGVSFEDCVRVSKRILDVDEQTGLIPEGCLLEVSSPGINRRLRHSGHFRDAVGERVKVKFRDPSNAYRTVTGTLRGVEGDSATVESEERGEVLSFHLRDVKEARVDFKF